MNSLFYCIRHLGIRLGPRYWLLNRRAKRDPEVIRDFARACRREAFFCDDDEAGNRLSDFARQCDRSYESLQNSMKTFIPLLISALLLSACATNPTLAKFNAAAGPRASQDVAAAVAGATGAVATQLAASLQANGKIDPSVLGGAAAVGAVSSLVRLDLQRAQQTNP